MTGVQTCALPIYKLIVTYEVQPIVKKLQQALIFAAGLLLGLTLASIIWAILD